MANIQRAKELITMAQADCEAAMAASIPYTICFHAQQAAEKYLKAFLVYHGQPAARSHDLADLVNRCAKIDASLGELLPLASSLQPFAVEIRYAVSKEIADQ